jgi:hypothetical protein
VQITNRTNPTWRRLLLAGAALVLAALFPSTLAASERWETLEAIHWIENPLNTERPGRCGELGAYQFREATWRMHTMVPFARATDRRVSDDVAIRHYEWLKTGLARAGIEVTPYTIALAWNGGLATVVRGSVRPATRDYAERVNNIAEQIRKSQVASNR